MRKGRLVRTLSAAHLLEVASERTGGLRDFGGEDFREGLERLLQSLQQDGAHVGSMGWELCQANILQGLINRLRIQETVTQRPEVRAVAIKKPIVIVGFPRTGTTFLHRLLAQAANAYAPPFWQLWAPAPPAHSVDGPDSRIAEAESMLQYLDPVRHMHEMGSMLPDECVWLHRNTFVSVALAYGVHAPSYLQWVHQQPGDRIYDYYRLQLQILSLNFQERHLVLKAPTHHWYLPTLLQTFPDVSIVYTVRPPRSTLGSFCSYTHANLSLWSDNVDRRQTGTGCAYNLLAMAGQLLQVRDQIPPERIFFVHYKDLLSDPIRVARGIYDHFGYATPPDFDACASSWMAANPQHKHGQHRYHLSDFVSDAVLEQFEQKIAPYCESVGTTLE